MEEFGLKENTLPQVTTENKTAEEENRSDSDRGITIPVKFNKEIKNLRPKEAGVLAQKGLKFDAIAKDYEQLKSLALQNGKSVPEFLEALRLKKEEDRKRELTEQCGGNEEMAAYVLTLEEPDGDRLGFEELQKEFPAFKTPEDLPAEVVEGAKLKGRLLLDEYLRYRHESKKAAQTAARNEDRAKSISIGSLQTRAGSLDPEAEEFLKGILK